MLQFDQVLEALSSTLEKVLKAHLSTSTKMLDPSLVSTARVLVRMRSLRD